MKAPGLRSPVWEGLRLPCGWGSEHHLRYLDLLLAFSEGCAEVGWAFRI